MQGGPWALARSQAGPSEARKQFFFEKKNQKTFEHWGARWVQRAPQ